MGFSKKKNLFSSMYLLFLMLLCIHRIYHVPAAHSLLRGAVFLKATTERATLRTHPSREALLPTPGSHHSSPGPWWRGHPGSHHVCRPTVCERPGCGSAMQTGIMVNTRLSQTLLGKLLWFCVQSQPSATAVKPKEAQRESWVRRREKEVETEQRSNEIEK